MPRRNPPARTESRIAMGQAIRMARRASGLTQEALGKRLGLEGRAIHRWERADAAPTRRNQRALVLAIQAVSPQAAARLAAALASTNASEGKPAPLAVPSPIPASAALELAVFGLAEDLELAPRRVRSALLPFFKRLRATNLEVEQAERLLEGMLQAVQDSAAQATERR